MLAVAAATLATLLGGAVALPAATHEHRALFSHPQSKSNQDFFKRLHAMNNKGTADSDEWKAALTSVDPGYAAALRRASSTDAAGAHHLYFYSLDRNSPGVPGGGSTRCGEVDAAPYMPAAIFRPEHFLSLAAYAKATVELYRTPTLNTAVLLGRCADNGFPSGGTGRVGGIGWTPISIMIPVCLAQCATPQCPTGRCDVPDDPVNGKFCSLCGPSTSCPGCGTTGNTVRINLWGPPARQTNAPTPAPTSPPPTSPPSPGNTLWFRFINNSPGFGVNRCGEIDAAPRMPSSIFMRGNEAALHRYIAVTKEWGTSQLSAPLELGRCAAAGYAVPAGTAAATWAPNSFMQPLCKAKCDCTFANPGFANNCNGGKTLVDDPAKGVFCSLCYFFASSSPNGREIDFNKPATIDLFTPSPNIVALAVATPDLSTLVAAVKAAGLVDTLSGAGPFTVFAPTNAAFAAIQSVVDQLLLPEYKPQLIKLLTYHVLASKVVASAITNGESVATVEGQQVCFEVNHRTGAVGVFPCGSTARASRVTTADVLASNGVVHIIDEVLVPAGFLPLAPAGKQTYVCLNNQCVVSASGVSKDDCSQICGGQ